jgi:hypothetical protein
MNGFCAPVEDDQLSVDGTRHKIRTVSQ